MEKFGNIEKLLASDDISAKIDFLVELKEHIHSSSRRISAIKFLKENNFAEPFARLFCETESFKSKKTDELKLNLLIRLCNCSHHSADLSRQIGDQGDLLKNLVANLGDSIFDEEHQKLPNWSNKLASDFRSYSFATLNNTLRHTPEAKGLMKSLGMRERMRHFMNGQNPLEQLRGMMVMCWILDEQESDELDDEQTVDFFTKTFLKDPVREGVQLGIQNFVYSLSEFIDAIAKLAVNEKNKKRIGKNSAILNKFEAILSKSQKVDELRGSCQCIWALTYDDEICEELKKRTALIQSLDKLAKHQDNKVKRQAGGALFVLKNKISNRVQSAKKKTDKKDHVFISYSWQHKEIMIKIKDHIKKNGYRVWMDVEDMQGSTLEAMADGIEKSSVALISISEAYKESNNCRLEANYIHKLGIPFVPLLLQRKYKADGWLGIMIGTDIYIDYMKHNFNTALDMTIKELRGRGKDNVTNVEKPEKMTNTAIAAKGNEAVGWDKDRVLKWLQDIGLRQHKPKFASYNGKMITYMAKIHEQNPFLFHEKLEKHFKMNFDDAVTFSQALEEL